MYSLHPRKCTVTGKGFSEGFMVGDDYAIDQKSADKLAIESGYTSYLDAHNEDEDFAYWTQWDESEVTEQGYGYTEEGKCIFITEENVIKQLETAIKEEIKDLDNYIHSRATANGFNGEDDELHDMDLSSDEMLNWSTEDRENHSFDLGAFIRLNDLKDKFDNIFGEVRKNL